MATLPVTGYVVGAALSAPPVARLQRALGRKRSFQIGLLVAMVTAALCALAVTLRQLLAAGGRHAGGGLLQRQRRAVPLCRAGTGAAGLQGARHLAGCWPAASLGAFIGPNLASATRDGWRCPSPAPIWRWWAWRCCRCWRCRSSASRRTCRPHPARAAADRCRDARQPLFFVAVDGRALGYGVMNLLMAATPIAMQQCAASLRERGAGAGVARAGHVRARASSPAT
jgi:MFS family permease